MLYLLLLGCLLMNLCMRSFAFFGHRMFPGQNMLRHLGLWCASLSPACLPSWPPSVSLSSLPCSIGLVYSISVGFWCAVFLYERKLIRLITVLCRDLHYGMAVLVQHIFSRCVCQWNIIRYPLFQYSTSRQTQNLSMQFSYSHTVWATGYPVIQ